MQKQFSLQTSEMRKITVIARKIFPLTLSVDFVHSTMEPDEIDLTQGVGVEA